MDPVFGLFDFSRPWLHPGPGFTEERDGIIRLRPGVSYYASAQSLGTDRAQSEHGHAFLEALIVCHGRLRHAHPGQKRVLRPFEALFLQPGQRHAFQGAAAGTLILNLCFLPSLLGFSDQLLSDFHLVDLVTLLGPFRPGPSDPVHPLEPANAKRILFHAFTAVERLRYHATDPQNLGRQAFLLAVGLLLESVRRPSVVGRDARVLDLLSWLQAHSREKISQKDLARRCGLSSPTLSTEFNRLTGSTLGHYVNRLRLEDAQNLLHATTWPIGRIALEVGYENIGHFNEVFRAVEGMTPTAFRRGKSEKRPAG